LLLLLLPLLLPLLLLQGDAAVQRWMML